MATSLLLDLLLHTMWCSIGIASLSLSLLWFRSLSLSPLCLSLAFDYVLRVSTCFFLFFTNENEIVYVSDYIAHFESHFWVVASVAGHFWLSSFLFFFVFFCFIFLFLLLGFVLNEF